MSTVEITQENFKETVGKGIVVLDWWAEWCGPCRAFAPIFEKVAGKNPDVVFGKVNTEEQQALAAQFGIRSIPTLMVFRDNVLLLAQPGMLPEAALKEVVQKVRDLDMDEVRRQIAEEEAKPQASAAVAHA